MPGNFLNFLQFYMDLPEAELEEKKEEKTAATSVLSLTDAELRKKAVRESREFIKDATKDKDFSLVSRVFNNFPITFQTEDAEQKFAVIEADVFKNWFDRLFEFLKMTTIKPDMDDPAVLNIQGGKEKQGSKEFIFALVDEWIIKACEELLDENGELDARVIDLLQLNELFEKHKLQPQIIKDLKFRVIYSYCIQIALGNMLEKLDEKAKATLPPDLYAKFSLNCGYCSMLFTQIFFNSEKIMINDRNVVLTSFTPHVEETVRAARHRRFINTPLPEQCAIELAKISVENVDKLIRADFAKMQLVNEQMKVNNLKQKEEITTHKITFWVDVCDFYRRQIADGTGNKKYYELMVMILLWVEGQAVTLNPEYSKKYKACHAVAGQAMASEHKEHKTAATIAIPRDSIAIEKINKIFAADINHYVMKELEDTGRLAKTTANTKVVDKIQTMMSDPDYVRNSPEKMLAIFARLASGHEIQLGLKIYQEAFDRVNFYLRIQSDVAMLRSVFERIPNALQEYRINNYFPQDSSDIQISLKSFLPKLEEQITALKSEKSSVKFDEWVKNYRGILLALTNGMCNALSQELKKNLRYIQANPEMFETWEGFLALASSMRTEINTLKDQTVQTIDIAEWQKKFKKICNDYVRSANKLTEFSATIEKIKAPSEGDAFVRKRALDLKLAYFFTEFKSSLPETDQVFIPLIQTYMSTVGMSPEDFFKSQFKGILRDSIQLSDTIKIKDPAQSERILQAYQEGLDRANFILHIESSMRGLEIVFAEIPAVFITNVDQAALLGGLTLQLADLKSAKSYAEFSTMKERLYLGLQKMADILFLAINQGIKAYETHPAMRDILIKYRDLTTKMNAALSMPKNFNFIQWQVEFKKICEDYIAYTTRFHDSSFVLSQPEEKGRSSQRALEVRFDPLIKVVSDPDALAEVTGAFTKSKNTYVKPDTKKHDLAVLQAKYPAYPQLVEIIEDLNYFLGTRQIKEAIQRLIKLPPQVIRELRKYCSIHQAMLNNEFKSIFLAAKDMHDDQFVEFVKKFNQPVEEEKKAAAPPQPLPSSQAAIQHILANFREAHSKSAIVGGIIARLNDLNAIEFIAMLRAEQLAVESVSGSISKSLLKCIDDANKILKVPPIDTSNIYFTEAIKLLTFADKNTPTKFSETSAHLKLALLNKSSEVDDTPLLRRAAMLMVKLSLADQSRPLPKDILTDLQTSMEMISNPKVKAELTSLSNRIQAALKSHSDSVRLSQGGGGK